MADIFELSDKATDQVAADNPVAATYDGVVGFDGLWPDLSPDGVAASQQMWSQLNSAAAATEVRDARHQLARDVLVEDTANHLAGYEADFPFYNLNNIASPHQELRFVFGSMDKSTADGWNDILQRLETIDQPLSGYQQTLELGRSQSKTVARRQIETALEQGRSAIGPESSFDQLREQLAEAAAAEGSGIDHAALSPRLDAAIDHAKASFAKLNDYFEHTYAADAQEVDGVGVERYKASAEYFLGCELDIESTYAWGWSEVERLWQEMQVICAEIDPDKSVEEVMVELKTSPKYAVDTEEAFIAAMTERQHSALEKLDGVHFDVPEQIRSIDVQVEPGGGATAAHYVPPSEDFARAGSVWYPVKGNTHFPLFTEVTTAYHEGFPGHHLQCGIQAAMGDELSRYHRTMVWNSGSGEGWALYAERFMDELGYLERPEYKMGLLTSQMFRSCRIAIDIGIHTGLAIPNDVSFHPGEQWSFDLALELLMTRGLEAEKTARSELTRYCGWPGQAITYKVGEQAILDMRDEHSKRPDFSLKKFHSDLLAVGSVGLDLLKRQMA